MPIKPTVLHCPCGKNQSYENCCGRYISGAEFPEDAESLMRSRYTAYTQSNIDYIQATMQGPATENFNAQQAVDVANATKWRWLKVHRAFPHDTDPDCAYVEFTAFYILYGQPEKLHELSEFKKINGRWYYVGMMG
ncbi:MAG: YchJ family metal-binding protein [Gammaproteobacteria bacterium]